MSGVDHDYCSAGAGLTLLALLLVWPAATLLPGWWGWENGPLENLQVVELLAGAWFAWHHAARLPQQSAARGLWRSIVPLWLLCAGRELAWGRVFMQTGVDATGPVLIDSAHLWYDPAIQPVAGAIGLLALIGIARHGPLDYLRRHRLPWIDLALFVIAATIAQMADKGMTFGLNGEVLEEAAETVVYWGMLCMQWHLASPASEAQCWRQPLDPRRLGTLHR